MARRLVRHLSQATYIASSGAVARLNPLLRRRRLEFVRCGGDRPWSHRLNRLQVPAPYGRVARTERGLTMEGRGRFHIPIDRCTTRYLFSYSETGWHPLVRALEHSDGHLQGLEAFLAEFYRLHQPGSLADLFSAPRGPVADQLRELPANPAIVSRLWNLSPWLLRSRLREASTSAGQEPPTIYLGPQSEASVREKAARLHAVYDSIARTGYRPSESEAHRIAGFFLVDGDAYRFVLCSGNHRVAVLRSLGYETCMATFMPGHPYAVNREQLHRWTRANGGIYEPEVAAWIFSRYFAATGVEVAESLGIS